MDNEFKINELSVAFQTPQKTISAIDGLSLVLKPGETVALLGESGCGKSMTALALMRLLPTNAVYGHQSQLLLDGVDLLNLPEQAMRDLRGNKLAMIFQEPMTALNPVLTVGQQLGEVILKQTHYDSLSLKERMVALLQEVELSQPELRLNQYPHELSGGQKQRVVIAQALACNPKILIADEPTTALDVTIQAQILNLLKRLQAKHGMSLLFITHDLGVAKTIADRICVMYAGQIVELAGVDEFFTRVLHPYSQQLLEALPNFSKRNQRLSAIPGKVPALDEMPSGCRFHPRCQYAFSTCSGKQPKLKKQETGWVRCHLYPKQSQLSQLSDLPVYNPEILPLTIQAPLLRVENLKVYYYHKLPGHLLQKGCLKAVDQVNFSLHPGKTLAIVGESGSGKTTVSRALLRLIPVTDGQVYFHDQNVLTMNARQLKSFRRKAQIIFQDPFSSMNPRLTVEEILKEGMTAQGIPKRKIILRLNELLDQVSLPLTSLNRYPHQFSGGQRQRLCIARALATSPELLICDEPTSALDVSVQAQILNLLQDLQKEFQIAYLFITHNMGVVSYLADQVMVMKEGRIVEQGSCEAILKAPKAPYTQQLLNSVLEV